VARRFHQICATCLPHPVSAEAANAALSDRVKHGQS
jgi:hypothetical protein